MNRRRFVDIFLGGALIGTLASFLYPVLRYLIPPQQAEALLNRIAAAKTGELAPNTWKLVKFGSIPALLISTPDGELRAFSAVCTHLTCTVNYDGETGTLLCPCHNGRFDLAGNVISGPPPRPLEAFQVEISGSEIYISKKG